MNIFRLCGDMLHLLSILILMVKLNFSKSCSGVSARMQEMYLIVFVFRYMDLFWNFVSVYNSVMKMFFISSSLYLVTLMRFRQPICRTYDREADNFAYEKYCLGPAFLLGLMLSDEWVIYDVAWSTSIWLECVAIVPQLMLLQKQQEVENLTSHFVGAMGLYRGFYILNWIYRYIEEDYYNYVGWIAGFIQTCLYLDFFYHYYKSLKSGTNLVLPMAS